MRVIAVLTGDRFLFRKVALALPDDRVTEDPAGAAVCFAGEGADVSGVHCPVFRMGESGECDLVLPCRLADIRRLADSVGSVPPLTVTEGRRVLLLHGERVALTEVEAALFSALYDSDGFLSREELLRRIWNGKADGGVLNVYIHYLREKLERGGEKIILSSRKLGYAIDGKYKGGRTECSN